MKRHIALDQVRGATEPFDMIIVGGGATGLGRGYVFTDPESTAPAAS